MLLTASTEAQTADSAKVDEIAQNRQTYFDGLKVYLLTCGPGKEAYSLFGHTAIRISQPEKGQDFVVNYGMFSFSQDYFVLRFVFGITDYQMGICDYYYFEQEYRSEGRWVFQQELNLKNGEKEALLAAIDENYKPENRTYRYNFFYNNCTSKARDIIFENLEGSILNNNKIDETVSFRELCHSKTSNHRWSQFGNDLLLGIKADLPTDRNEQQFLPENLMHDFSEAVVVSNGKQRKLVKSENFIVDKQTVTEEPSIANSLTSPRALLAAISIIILAITIFEIRNRRIFWLTDAVLLLTTGAAGVILFAMIFSGHPTVRINLQILVLNPVSLFMAIPFALRERKKSTSWWHKVYILCLVFGIIGGLFQHYAEGILILALSLLVRYVTISMLCNRLASVHGAENPTKQK